MNTDFLNTLAAVAQYGSMAQAARRLGLTHGAVAQQVRKLEQELGVSLVARAGRTVHLTAKATELIGPMREVLERIEKIRHLARSDEMMGELRLGAGSTALNSMVPAILEHLVRRHPLISVEIQPGHSARFYPAIESGELDAAIALEAPYPLSKSLGWQLLREETYVLAAAPRHAGRDAHSLLTGEPFIRYRRSDWSGRHVEDYLRRVGITPHDRFELNAIESIAVMVSRDLGVAILPRSTTGAIERLGLLALPLPVHCEPRRFGLIWSRGSPRLALIQAFRDIAMAQYAAAAR
ncbi:LysR family transcriptional regulator [Achromobacter sp. NFACC18-2]|uniref:LysR family transcriptional regulator n=1 Tax=Achromobacter sp. NFACC18-2 TaxID=1564112 RepID=UPI0008C5BC9E|nr:LysR family transcriptional regulator [Achromobacter sp. NFACC18-2]SEJ61822.1 ModE molybdate transport repressor domain-containing protein [Achromobacter sp. NFACC18-2]